ncbi:MAG TPA: hypothetical protein VJS64_02525 [Pyrinomonadaceae bacterium]|nr:hypothetical protein [Pyrinomonadaceae bacterium]
MLGLILFFCSCFNPLTLPANSTANHLVQDRAIIQRRRIVVVRDADVAKHFPNRKTALVTYPVVSGLSPQTLRKVRALLSFKNIFDYSLAEYRSDPWLSEFSYVVNHNANSLLDITFTQSGMAAYPDEQSKHFLIDLNSGKALIATDVFETDTLTVLATAIDEKLQREITELRKENAGSTDRDADEKVSVNDAYDILKFESKDLDNFSVSDAGITFLYDAGFPHVIRALEPKGRYFFSYAELRPVIKTTGPLGQFVR